MRTRPDAINRSASRRDLPVAVATNLFNRICPFYHELAGKVLAVSVVAASRSITPFGPIEVEVLTNDLESRFMDDDRGELEIDYEISLKGLLEGRNKLNITVM